MNKRALLELALMSGALLMGSDMPAEGRVYSEPERDPGPIVGYDRSAIRAQAAADRKAKHAAKLARRAAQKERNRKP